MRIRTVTALSFLLLAIFGGCAKPPGVGVGEEPFRYGDKVTYEITGTRHEWNLPKQVSFEVVEPFTYYWIDGAPRDAVRVAYEAKWNTTTKTGFFAIDTTSGRTVYRYYYSDIEEVWRSSYTAFGQPFGFGSSIRAQDASCFDRGTAIETRTAREGLTLRVESDAGPILHDRAWMPCVGNYSLDPESPWVAQAQWTYVGQDSWDDVFLVTATAEKVSETRGSDPVVLGDGPLPSLPAAKPLPQGAIPGHEASRGYGLTVERIVEGAKAAGPRTKEFFAQNPNARVYDVSLQEPAEAKCATISISTCIFQSNAIVFVAASGDYLSLDIVAQKETWPNPGDWTFTERENRDDVNVHFYPRVSQQGATKIPVKAIEEYFLERGYTVGFFTVRVERFTILQRHYWYEFVLGRTGESGVVFRPPQIRFQSDTGLPNDASSGAEEFMLLLRDGIPFGMPG